MVAMDSAADEPQLTDRGSRATGSGKAAAAPSSTATGTASKASPNGSGRRAAASTAKAVKSPRTAKKTPKTDTAARRSTGKTTAGPSSDEPGGSGEVPSEPGRPWPRRFRSRALYNRRIQRESEHWPLVTQLGAWLFSHPGLLLSVLGTPPRVAVDGRVLNRSIQAVLALANRVEARSGTGPDGTVVYDPVVMRRQLTRMARLAMPIRTDVHVTGRVIPGPPGAPDIPVRVYRQFGTGIGADAGSRPGAIVYFHGGGWVTGDLDSHDSPCRLLAAASGCIVVAIGYRLAPEDPFPAPVDDAIAAYGWVQRHSDELGHAPGQVGVMGDSAGGNLAAVVALETRPGAESAAADVPPPVAQCLVYPAVDARFDSDSIRALSDGFFLTSESMEFFRSTYLPDVEARQSAKASPLLAGDHRGLAPALVVTAGFDPLRDDGANYADALRRSGVEVEYRCYDDQVHGFMGMGFLPDSLALATEICDAMGRLMRRSMRAGTENGAVRH